jgi:hypothetical protein
MYGGVVVMVALRRCSGAAEVGCEYWHQQCADVPECIACLNAMGNRKTIADVVGGSMSRDCASVRSNQAVRHPLLILFEVCPAAYVSPCVTNAAFCVLDHPICGECLDGTMDPASPNCQALLNNSGYAVTSLCTPCSDSVLNVNKIVFMTSVVGGISVAGCLLVVLVIVAHSKDVHSARARIVVGLILANCVYSAVNAVPLNELRTGPVDCGQLKMSFEAIRLGRAWWYGGKFALVGYEMMILGTSIWALTRGARAFRGWIEIGLHCMCVALGVGALVGFYIACAAINAQGYNGEAHGPLILVSHRTLRYFATTVHTRAHTYDITTADFYSHDCTSHSL